MKHNVYLTELAHKKIDYWVQKADTEVSGFGMVKYDPKLKRAVITDAFLIEQVVTGGSTDIDDKGLAKLLFQTAKLDGECLFWWHSHVNFAVNWSGTDIDTIKKLGNKGWIFASVFNKRGEIRSACAYQAVSSLDGGQDLVIHETIDTFIEQPEMNPVLKKHLDDEFAAKVKRWVHTPKSGATSYTRSKGEKGYQSFLERHTAKDKASDFANVSADEEDDSDLTVEAVAVRNIMSQQGELEGDMLEDQLNFGLRGYGYEVEAEALNIDPDILKSILRKNNHNQLANLEDRLIGLESDGTLDKILDKKMKEYEAEQEQLPTEGLYNERNDKH